MNFKEVCVPVLFSPLSIAPMIDWSYLHFRLLMRILAPHALVYTEMQTTGAIENNSTRALQTHPSDKPVALQLGGADKDDLVRSAERAQAAGFVEVNLNLGCPSDRVQAGRFGACLMTEGTHVAACISAMKAAVDIPVTAKTRIGIDLQDSYAFFSEFATQLVDAGCDKLVVHARKAWLKGLSPKQNRSIPPLHYDYVYQFKKEHAHLPIVINGNIQTLNDVQHHLRCVDGVMIGRMACQNPYLMAFIHQYLYPSSILLSRAEVLQRYLDLVLNLPVQVGLGQLIKPILNLAHGLPGSKAWREQLVNIQQQGVDSKLFDAVISLEELERVIDFSYS